MKIKAIFCLLFMAYISFFVSGCSFEVGDLSLLEGSFFAHSIYLASDNKVTETILVNFENTNLQELEKQALMVQTSALFNSKEVSLENYYSQKLFSDGDNFNGQFGISNNIEGEKVIFKITYQNQDAWQYFSTKTNQPQTQKVYHFFTYTYIDRVEKAGSIFVYNEEEIFFADYLKQETFEIMNDFNQLLLENISIKSVYAYVTTFSRRHSSADIIAPLQGNYFHIWDTSTDENISLYLILPRVQNWYLVGLVISFTTLGLILLFSFKEKPNRKKKDLEDLSKPRIKTIDE